MLFYIALTLTSVLILLDLQFNFLFLDMLFNPFNPEKKPFTHEQYHGINTTSESNANKGQEHGQRNTDWN
jgi:hypothetical protein